MIAPKLRFNEFEEDWQTKKLGDLVTIKSGYSPSKYDLNNFGEVPFLKVEELNNCDKYQEKSRFYSDLNKDIVAEKSVIFPKRGAAILNNKVRLLKVPALLDSNLMALTFNSEENPEFYYYLINKIELFKIADTSTIPQINNKHIEPYEVLTTTKEEQTKIAEFLSAVDDKISQLSRQLELLKQYKKGVMQKIFSQEIRFKNDNGEDFGEWEEVPLNFVCDVRDGTHDSPKYVKKGYALVTSKNLKDGKLDLTDISLISQTDFDNINKRSKVHTGDIIFGMIGTIGNPVLLKESNFAIKNVALIKEKDELLNKFLIHFLNSSSFDRQVKVLNAGNTQKFLSLNQIRNLSVPKPTIQEQEKIAEFLTAIDERIDHTTAQLTQTKQWKKGLLQQMFV